MRFKFLPSISILAALSLILSSCEGTKALSVKNDSTEDMYIETSPPIPDYSDPFYPVEFADTGAPKRYVVKPGSFINLYQQFTTMVINHRIHQSQLHINYLRIITANDTIVARSKQEIIDLLYDRSKRLYADGSKRYSVDNKVYRVAIVKN